MVAASRDAIRLAARYPPFYLADRPLFGMLVQAVVTCRNLQHLPPGGWMGHLFGLTPRILRTRQPIAHIKHTLSCRPPLIITPPLPPGALWNVTGRIQAQCTVVLCAGDTQPQPAPSSIQDG